MEAYATDDGHKTFYRKDGGQGPPAFFIRGVPTSSQQWRPVQDLLAPYLTTYTIDLSLGWVRVTGRA